MVKTISGLNKIFKRIVFALSLVLTLDPFTQTGRADMGQNYELQMEFAEGPIPFQLRGGFLIVIDVKIGPLSGLKFILDTGTTHSVLDTKTADKLSLARQDATVLNFNRQLKIGWSYVPDFQIGSLHIHNLRMMVASLRDSSDFADTVDGIIGLDVLGLYKSVRINFDDQLLTLARGRASDDLDLSRTRAFAIHLNVQGQQLCLILDTGLRDIVLFQDRIRNNAPHLKLIKKTAGGHEGRFEGDIAVLGGIRIGSGESQRSAFVIRKAPQSLPADIDGFLGVRALNSSLIELNFEVRTLRLVGAETTTLAMNESRMLSDAKAPDRTQSSYVCSRLGVPLGSHRSGSTPFCEGFLDTASE